MAGEGARGGISHCATVECAVPAERAFAFLCDGAMLGRWAFGCWQAEPRENGLVVGRSLFHGGETWARAVGDPRLLSVDYHVGASPDALVPRIMARVVPGPVVGRGADVCLVSLIAWRDQGMDDARWHRLVACHEVEILLIQALLARPA